MAEKKQDEMAERPAESFAAPSVAGTQDPNATTAPVPAPGSAEAKARADEQAKAMRAADGEAIFAVDPARWAEKQAEIAVTVATEPRDETIPGGRFKMGDAWVNAWGEEIDEDGEPKDEEAHRLRVARER